MSVVISWPYETGLLLFMLEFARVLMFPFTILNSAYRVRVVSGLKWWTNLVWEFCAEKRHGWNGTKTEDASYETIAEH